ncbi:hypothetical protein K2Z84_10060 [Candidatus Binatia bacterium]|jgi:hypothetical protein|nr:hypothetical protein [Candidatus Binatia bacterium]
MKPLVVALALAAWACAPSSYPGAVKPAPPGPVDVVRSMWGDYGGRCPDRYRYCPASGQAICCPIEARCAEDSGGAYCAARGGPQDRYGDERFAAPCAPEDLTCSYAGRTTCCASDQRCCAADGGPACCSDDGVR